MRASRVFLDLFLLSVLSGAGASAQAVCVCTRTDTLTEPTRGNSCNGGVHCYDYAIENNVPVPEGEENGRCKPPNDPVCTADAKPCKFPSYKIRVTSSGCASACATGTLSVKVTTPQGYGASGTMPAQNGAYPPLGSPGLDFSVPDQACDSPTIIGTITVSSGTGIVYMVQRTSACSQCQKSLNG